MRIIRTRRIVAALVSAFCLVAGLNLGRATMARAATNNTEIAVDYFVHKGLTRQQSAGLVGNFIVESGKDPINPAAVQYGGGPGRGIAQREGSRRTALFNYAAQRKLSWSNLGLQLDFVWKELTGPESRALGKIKATRTARDAAVAVRVYYERPLAHADAQRIAAAQRTYDRYANNVGGPPQPPATETAFPSLKAGSTNKAAVTTLQYNLRAKGHKIAADGSFGPGTRNAVIAFQKSKRLAADGVAGPKTWAALAPTLKQGSTGDAVRALQLELRAAGHSIAVDGTFGAGTKGAVIVYQKKVGLAADGVVGVKTWGSLVD